MNPAGDQTKGEMKYAGYRRKLAVLIITVVVIVSGFAIYYSLINRPSSQNALVIYTYNSLLQYGLNNTSALNTVFGTFEQQHNVDIVVKRISGSLLTQLASEKSHPAADIVIGLSNMNGVQASQQGLLVNYTPPVQKYINSSLLGEMGSAASFITPYEYSYLGIDYNKSFVNTSFFTPSFEDLSNASVASNLLLENPTVDDTGEGFLLWEIAYYQNVLHRNWTSWWSAIKPYVSGHVYSSWDFAFGAYNTGDDTNLVVSYLTDPAYNEVWGYGNTTGSAVTYHNGTAYGWRTIYGLGIVNGSKHLALDKEFINYFLSPTVQNEIPTNEWMYPANSTISLPEIFSILQDQNDIYPLNNYISANDIAANIRTWDEEWLLTMG